MPVVLSSYSTCTILPNELTIVGVIHTVYMEIFVVLKFCVIEIVMLFHNIQGVKF